jgi:hypothetical protein
VTIIKKSVCKKNRRIVRFTEWIWNILITVMPITIAPNPNRNLNSFKLNSAANRPDITIRIRMTLVKSWSSKGIMGRTKIIVIRENSNARLKFRRFLRESSPVLISILLCLCGD